MSWFNGLEHIVRQQEPMAPWNWLRLGGKAEFFAEPTTQSELQEVLKRADAEGLAMRVLGDGSNILIRDEGVKGVVVHLSAPSFCEIAVNGSNITAGGGARLNHVIATAAREGLAGLEALVGIPGSIGGALCNNAIGHGAAIGQWTSHVNALTRAGEPVSLARDDLRFSHRESNLDGMVVLDATFSLEHGDMLKVTRQMQKLWIMKRAKQPTGEMGHAQVFANPRGLTAGEIIEQAGLKGLQMGNVAISETDASYITVRSGASSDEVLALIDHVRSHVAEVLGVELAAGDRNLVSIARIRGLCLRMLDFIKDALLHSLGDVAPEWVAQKTPWLLPLLAVTLVAVAVLCWATLLRTT